MTERLGVFLYFMVVVLVQASETMELECNRCEPGHFMVSPCTEGWPNSTVCEMCKDRTFSPTDNNETSCINCLEPNHVVYSEDDTPVACRCAKGFHKRHSTCLRNPFCRPGKGVHKGGCQSCPEGQFSDRYSNIQHCRPLTNCTALGMTTSLMGTSRRDTICINTSAATGRPRHHRKDAKEEETGSGSHGAQNAVLMKSDRRVLKQRWESSTAYTSTKTVAKTPKNIEDATRRTTVSESAMYKIDMTDYLIIAVTASVFILIVAVVSFHIRLKHIGMKSKKRKVTCVPKQECGEDESECSEEVPTSPKNTEVYVHVDANDPPPYHSQHFQVNHCSIPVCENWDVTPGHCNEHNQNYDEDETCPKTNMPLGFSVSMELPNSCTALTNSLESLASSIASSASWETSPSSVAYRKRIQERLAQVVTNVLSRSAMEHLVGGLGREWQALAQRLGLTQPEIDHILNENRANLDQQIYEMIRRWQQGRAGEASISELYGALLECNMGELHNKLVSLEGNAA